MSLEWTPAQIKELRRLAKSGLTMGEAADRLGTTKPRSSSAAAAPTPRPKLPASDAAAKAQPVTKALPSPLPPMGPICRKAVAALPDVPRKRGMSMPPATGTRAKDRKPPTPIADAAPVPKVRKVRPAPQRALGKTAAVPPPAPEPRGVETILALTIHTCKWPLGHPGAADFRFCCAPTERPGQRPYCSVHRREAVAGHQRAETFL